MIITYLLLSIIKFLELLQLLVFVDALMSWIIRPRSNAVSKFLGLILDPVLKPCQLLQGKLLPGSPVDFSPLLALFLIEIVRRILLSVAAMI